MRRLRTVDISCINAWLDRKGTASVKEIIGAVKI